MTEAFLEDYFAGLAAGNKLIAHSDANPAFYRMADPMDLDEFDNALRSLPGNVALLLELGNGSLGTWDSQNDIPGIGLHCLIKSTDQFAAIHAARDQAKTIMLQLISRIRLDCKSAPEREDNQPGPLKTQNVVFTTAVKFSNMSGIDTNWYGKSFYFEFTSPVNLVYDPNNWTA